MLEDFKKFLARGNLLDLAVGFIMGAAFSTLVTTFTAGIVMPFVGVAMGDVDFTKKCWNLTDKPIASCAEALEKGVAVVQYGKFITDIITFIIVAIVMFIVARYAMKLFANMETDDGPTPEVELLTEIRDSLKK